MCKDRGKAREKMGEECLLQMSARDCEAIQVLPTEVDGGGRQNLALYSIIHLCSNESSVE